MRFPYCVEFSSVTSSTFKVLKNDSKELSVSLLLALDGIWARCKYPEALNFHYLKFKDYWKVV
nr:hypothetical protein [Leptospira weilii]